MMTSDHKGLIGRPAGKAGEEMRAYVVMALLALATGGCTRQEWEAIARALTEGQTGNYQTSPKAGEERPQPQRSQRSTARDQESSDGDDTILVVGTAPERQRESYQRLFNTLNRVFDLPRLTVYALASQDPACQTRGSRAGPGREAGTAQMTLCHEFGPASVRSWTMYHELWHAAAGGWGEALWDNEDAADEFGTFMLVFSRRRAAAVEVADWWSARARSGQWIVEILDRVAKGWTDRHGLSPERAQRLRRWATQGVAFERRWIVRLMPHLRSQWLKILVDKRPDLDLDALVQSELERRGVSE